MRILFLGAGAVGGYFGGRMAEAGADVTFLVRPARAAALADGLRIESPHGNAVVPVATLTAGEAAEPFDLVVLTCKAFTLGDALDAIAPHVREGTLVLPLLNGYAHLEAMDRRFPDAVVWGGVAQVLAALSETGAIQQFAPVQGLVVGPRAGQEATRPAAERFAAIASEAGLSARASRDIEQDMWDKWVFLAALAAGTLLMRASVGGILQADDGEALLLGLLEETTAVARAEGHAPEPERTAFIRDQLTNRGAVLMASLARDMERGGPIEGDHILGDMLRRARSHKLEPPLLRTAWTRAQVYEAGR